MSGPDYMLFFRDRAADSRGRPINERENEMSVAFDEYCNARLVVPILLEDLERLGDYDKCRFDTPWGLENAMLDASDNGLDLSAALNEQMDRGWVFRPMAKHERFQPGDLLALMSERARKEAVALLGAANVAKAINEAGAWGLLQHSYPE